jgi:hypothetical protein
LWCDQMMMSPMLSPIRADTIDDVSSPEHGGVAALVEVEVASLDDAIGTISSGDDEMDRRLTQQVISAPVTLTWPSPNGRIARSISEQIDSSPAAREFEDEMLRHDDERKEATEVAAAVCIQALFRGTRARAHAQQMRRERETERAREQLPQARSTRRQLQFDDRAPMDDGGVPRVTQARQNSFADSLRCCRNCGGAKLLALWLQVLLTLVLLIVQYHSATEVGLCVPMLCVHS